MKYQFGTCEIDLDTHQLVVNGVSVAVEPRVFELLRHFVENSDRLISHNELIEAVWKGRIVSDSAIAACISAARTAVGDSGKKQAIIKTVPRCGFRLVVSVSKEMGTSETGGQLIASANSAKATTFTGGQHVRFCRSTDGTRIAFATIGEGYPLVRAGHWLTHLEHDWQSPVWRPILNAFGRIFQVTRYDQRGNGLSDWSVLDYSLERFVDDLEAVVDSAGIERFALYGTSQGAPISIAYAVRHPERVSHLVLHGGYVLGRLIRDDPQEREEGTALQTLIRVGWGKPGSAFLKAFSAMFIPDGSKLQIDSLADLQRQTTSPENAANLRAAVDKFDVVDMLKKVTIPTLVLHAQNDCVHPLEQGRALAGGIGDAEFVMLDSANHIILEQEPAWPILFAEITNFISN